MTRIVLSLAVALSAAAAVGCGPGQAQSPPPLLDPIQGKAPPVVASHSAGAMKALPQP